MKAACGFAVTETGFHPSVLTYWRRRIAASARPHRAFEMVSEVVSVTGVLAGKKRRALDSTILDDAVARQDTVTQLIAQIRRDGAVVPAAGPVVGQDVEPAEDSDGTDGRWRIARQVAPDRVIPTVDPEARHAHKSREKKQDGFKAHVAVEPDTGLVTAATLTMAAGAENSDAARGIEVLAADPTITGDADIQVLADDRRHRPMIERSIAWLTRGARRVPYRGVDENHTWWTLRAASINLRTLLRLRQRPPPEAAGTLFSSLLVRVSFPAWGVRPQTELRLARLDLSGDAPHRTTFVASGS